MRQAQHGRKIRGRGRKPNNPLSRTYDSAGPDTKVRGTAAHIADRYVTLSRDALLSGDRVTAENYMQHAEHYIRIVSAAQEQAIASQQSAQAAQQTNQPQNNQQNGQRNPSRYSTDEPGAVNGQARESGDPQAAGENPARAGDNAARRGEDQRQARTSRDEAALVETNQPQTPAPQPAAPEKPARAAEEAVGEAVGEKAHNDTLLPDAAIPQKPSKTIESAPPKPAPKRRRRTKATEDKPALSDQAVPEPSGDPVS